MRKINLILKYLMPVSVIPYLAYQYVGTGRTVFLYSSFAIIVFYVLFCVSENKLCTKGIENSVDGCLSRVELDELNRLVAKGKDNVQELEEKIRRLNIENYNISDDYKQLTALHEEITTGYCETIMAFAELLESKGDYEKGHCRRVSDLACEIGRQMDLSARDLEVLRYSAILHDIGKLELTDTILNKSEILSNDETVKVKEHTVIAYGIIESVDFLRNSADVILQHHERYDGKGYPYGLEGEKINRLARIIALADAFEAMISERPYKKGKSIQDALVEIKLNRGKQFDPNITDILIAMIEETYFYSKEGQLNGQKQEITSGN